MATLEEYWEFAQLAQAAYVDFPTAINEDVRSSLQNSTAANKYIFSVTQANRLIGTEGFRVADISSNANDFFGFSATLLQDNRTGEFTLAIRGTELELLSPDLEYAIYEIGVWGVAANQIVSLYNYFQRLITPEGESVRQLVLEEMSLPPADGRRFVALPKPIPGPLPGAVDDFVYLAIDSFESDNAIGTLSSSPDLKLNVTGHSLGGHLAQALLHLFPNSVDTVYAHNTAGFYPENADLIFQLIDPFVGPLDQGRIQNVFSYNGGEYITNDLLHSQYGQRVGVLIEDQTPTLTGNHAIVLQARSLALHALFEEIDPDFDLGQGSAAATSPKIDALIRASAPDHPTTYEASLKSLVKLFLDEDLSVEELENLETFYEKLYAIRDVLGPDASSRAIESLTDKSANDLILAASNPDPTNTSAIAYRYALAALNPFAVTGFDYAPHNQDGALDLYDSQTRSGTLTEAWIADRAAFLVAKNEMYTSDGPFAVAAYGAEQWHYDDKALGYEIAVTAPVLGFELQAPESPRLAVFGGAGAEALEGEDGTERLYGGGGDMLSAGAAYLGELVMHIQTATRVSSSELTS